MKEKLNVINHITTLCNYDCSYCDVIKDKRFTSSKLREEIVNFISENHDTIMRYKFFGGEPLLAFKDIKYIIDVTHTYIGSNYEIVTNTTILTDEIGEYLEKYFSHIFFSIDSENPFNYEKVFAFIDRFKLEKKLYFNLIISPGKVDIALKQFQTLYDAGYRGFNILPVYFTKAWSQEELRCLSSAMKQLLDLSLGDASLRLYGFKENAGYDTSLANNTIFLDVDGQVYYSDMSSTFSGKNFCSELLLGKISEIKLSNFIGDTFDTQRGAISNLEENIYQKVGGQRELHRLMDYFSLYLSKA